MQSSNDKMAITLCRINASCPVDIQGETLIACLKGKDDNADFFDECRFTATRGSSKQDIFLSFHGTEALGNRLLIKASPIFPPDPIRPAF